MHPADIQASLKKRGKSQKDIAEMAGVSDSCVAHVLYSRGKSRKVADIIASIINKKVEQVWPGVYSPRR